VVAIKKVHSFNNLLKGNNGGFDTAQAIQRSFQKKPTLGKPVKSGALKRVTHGDAFPCCHKSSFP